jgi:hypothetical protein
MVGAGLADTGAMVQMVCSVAAMLPRSLHCGPHKARASGRDDRQYVPRVFFGKEVQVI